jgi:hypothetical protein
MILRYLVHRHDQPSQVIVNSLKQHISFNYSKIVNIHQVESWLIISNFNELFSWFKIKSELIQFADFINYQLNDSS